MFVFPSIWSSVQAEDATNPKELPINHGIVVTHEIGPEWAVRFGPRIAGHRLDQLAAA